MGYLGGEINNYDGMYGLNENVDINQFFDRCTYVGISVQTILIISVHSTN